MANSSKEVSHFDQIKVNGIIEEQYRSFYKYNWDSYGYDDIIGHIQATIDTLRCLGYEIKKKEIK